PWPLCPRYCPSRRSSDRQVSLEDSPVVFTVTVGHGTEGELVERHLFPRNPVQQHRRGPVPGTRGQRPAGKQVALNELPFGTVTEDRKSTRLNSSHVKNAY